MVDPDITKGSFFVVNLSAQNPFPIIPDWFITDHLNGKIQFTKLKLTSDASDRVWEVELDGPSFAAGWKRFSDSHSVRHDDVLNFRHDGDLVFHVIPFGRRFTRIHFLSSSTSDDEDNNDEPNIFGIDDSDEDVDEDIADAGDTDEEYSISKELLYPKGASSSKKRARRETESLPEKSYLLTHVTSSSLSRNHMSIRTKFARANGLTNKHCDIDLVGKHGKSVTMGLRHNKKTGQVFVQGHWKIFCRDNGIKAGTYCRFSLVENGPKPVLQLCPNPSTSTPEGNSSKANEKRIVSKGKDDEEIENEEVAETASVKQDRISTFEFKPYMLRSHQVHLPVSFTRGNEINKEGEITLVNEDGLEWKLQLGQFKGRDIFYIKSCKDFFSANGLTRIGDTFTLEAMQGGTSPILQYRFKAKITSLGGSETPKTRPRRAVQGLQAAARAEEETETPVRKRVRFSDEVGASSGRTRATNKAIADQENVQRKEPDQPCSICEQVAKVKQSVVGALTRVTQIRSEFEITERNLEDSLVVIEALEGMVNGIGKLFNINQV